MPVAVTLDQVVTTATGETTRKREQGNVVGTLTPEPAKLASAGNMSQLLTGRIPGLDVATPGGTIGSSARIRIRGASSLSLSNDPLLVIDGIRVDNSSASSTIGVGGQTPSRFNDLNPEDIEKVDVLKGPAAGALYGTAAANGVIQVTTKRGRSGKTRFTVYGETGTIKDHTVFPLNFAQVGRTTAGARTTNCNLDNQTRNLCTPIPDSLVSYSPLVSYNPFITGQRNAYGLSAIGGNDRVSFYIGGNYDRQQGVFDANVDQRVGGRMNLTRSAARQLGYPDRHELSRRSPAPSRRTTTTSWVSSPRESSGARSTTRYRVRHARRRAARMVISMDRFPRSSKLSGRHVRIFSVSRTASRAPSSRWAG